MKYLIIGFGVGVILLAMAPPRGVEGKCPNPGPPRTDDYLHYYHDRVFYHPIENGGIYSLLNNPTVWVEPNRSNNFTAAWVQIASYPSTYL